MKIKREIKNFYVLNCPFCGSTASLMSDFDLDDYKKSEKDYNLAIERAKKNKKKAPDVYKYFKCMTAVVRCDNRNECGAEGFIGDSCCHGEETEMKALKCWNTRFKKPYVPRKGGLCFRCEHRASYLEGGIQPRCECGDIDGSVHSCYMYAPVLPIILSKREDDRRPQFAGIFSARSNGIPSERNVDVEMDMKEYPNGNMLYWVPKGESKQLKIKYEGKKSKEHIITQKEINSILSAGAKLIKVRKNKDGRMTLEEVKKLFGIKK